MTTTRPGTRTIIYTRISKDDGSALGVARQEAACRELAATRGLDVIEVIVDNDFSAYQSKVRPGFEQLAEAMRAGDVDVVIAYHVDRLYRRTKDLERLVDIVETTGTQVFTVAAGTIDLANASGRMVARMLGAAAQHESERMSERLVAKMTANAHAGRPHGGAPYGYCTDRTIDAAEAAVIRHSIERVMAGESLNGLARELTATGVSSRSAAKWSATHVTRMLTNPAIAGLRSYRGTIVGPATWDAIIDRDTFDTLVATIKDPARKRRSTEHRYLLSGLVRNVHGENMIGGGKGRRGGGPLRRTYRIKPITPEQAGTKERAPGASVTIDAVRLETHVVESVLARLDGATLPNVDDIDAADAAAVELAEVDALSAELVKLRYSGEVTFDEWRAGRVVLDARRDAALAATNGPRRRRSALLAEPGAVRKAWPKLDEAQRQAIVAELVAHVEVGPAKVANATPVADRVRIVWADGVA